MSTLPETTEKSVDWSAMPAWINWLARDETGFWMGYTERPERERESPFWYVRGIFSATSLAGCCYIPTAYAPKGYEDNDWADTLLKRPSQTHEEGAK